jgi:kumamolisin
MRLEGLKVGRRRNLRTALPAAMVSLAIAPALALAAPGGALAYTRPVAPLAAMRLASPPQPVLSAGAARAAVAHATGAGRAPGEQQLQLVLPLVADAAGLQRFATAVSTPGSPEYARFESIPQLARRFGATERTRRRVVGFLRRAGATDIRVDATGLFVDAIMRVSTADLVFGTSLGTFHATTAHAATFTAPRTAVVLPSGLRGLVTGVVGLNTMPGARPAPLVHRPRTAQASDPGLSAISGYVCSTPSLPSPVTCAGTQSGCPAGLAGGGFTPNQYLTAYGYDTIQSAGTRGQGERVALIEIDGFKTRDIDTFARCFGLAVPQINGFGVGRVGRPLAPGGEATLDLEVLDAAAPNLKSIDVYESKADAADTLMALTQPLQNAGYKPQVISASLGLCELFTVQDVGHAGIRAAESTLQEAAASGISFLAASGDDGSADCTQNGTPTNQLGVNYPASSPWATGVGGTNFMLNAENQIIASSQVVWNDGAADPGAAAGGGFSSLFLRPAYQAAVVSRNARAVPDVSMLADVAPGYAIYCSANQACLNGHTSNPWQTVGGTSAATPLLAGGLALLDQLLRGHQLQSLGLANPLLYQLGENATLAAQVFDDVTTGSNDVGPFVGGQPLGCCTATPGYDEASGWGGVNLGAFATEALTMQPKIVNVALGVRGAQHPIRAAHIVATISCSGPCLSQVAAAIKIGSRRPFTASSPVIRLTAAGARVATVTFSRKQLGMLRAALANHVRILAAVQGAIVDPAGNVERRSQVSVFPITS